MAQVPDPQWGTPSENWTVIIDRYVRFRRVKAWRGRTHSTEGVLNPNRLTAKQGRAVRRRLHKVADQRRLDSTSSREVKGVFKGHRIFSKAPIAIQDLWRAYLLNREGYSCTYCGRNAWDVHKELGATLRFELDHRRPRSLQGKNRNDFDLRNIVVACRSCNVIKGQMSASQFRKELRSLAKAVDRIAARTR